MTAGVLLVLLLAASSAQATPPPGPEACGGNAQAMMHAALLAEAEYAIRHEKAKCIAVAQGGGDPPSSVLFALRRRLRLPVVAKSRAGDCTRPVLIWVDQPYCSSPDVASVSSGYHQHCGYAVLRERGRFVAHPPVVCE
jgi:hypothetical protein